MGMACMGAELITKSPILRSHPVVGPIIENRLNSLPEIFMYLFQFTNDDSPHSLYVPIIQAQPYLAIYFLVSLVVVSFLLMNLVTAMIVEDSIKRSHQDEDLVHRFRRRKFQRLKPIITAVYEEMDADHDGQLEISEILNSIGHIKTKVPHELQAVLSPERLADIFEYIDLDGSGELSREEFTEGVGNLAVSNVAVETTQILTILREQRRRATVVEKILAELCQDLDLLFGRPVLEMSEDSEEQDPEKPMSNHDRDRELCQTTTV